MSSEVQMFAIALLPDVNIGHSCHDTFFNKIMKSNFFFKSSPPVRDP